jgi:hypothetical protein
VLKARLIYLAVIAVLIAAAFLPAFGLLPDGPHDGSQI